MLDFNGKDDVGSSGGGNAERDELRAALLARLESVLFALFPAGKVVQGKFVVGDVLGSPGRSLEIELDGERAGLWIDRATGNGGDIFALIAAHRHWDTHRDFAAVLGFARELLGRAPAVSPIKRKASAPVDELGPATAKWDYLAADGSLIACVYRYEPAPGRKEFRPWDAKRRKMAPPDPRPLFNQPGIAHAEQVILVEGEKCAQALIDAGYCATTAMHGANAPIDKTDWSPLQGKDVLIWPDRDKPGWECAMNAAEAVMAAGAHHCAVLMPPANPTADAPNGAADGWDAADALADGFDVQGFLADGERIQFQPSTPESGQTSDPTEPSVWATEDALALTFSSRYAQDWRYVALWGKWVFWTGKRWQTEETLAAHHLMRQICREAALKADSHRVAAKLASSGTVAGLERLARSDRRHAATADEWDANPWLLNTPGGVVNLKNGVLSQHDRQDRLTKITTATPSGDCPTWRQFLNEVTGGDRTLQAYLARMAGYALTGSTREHALFFLYGTGANGKSVFVNTLATILGDYATNAPMDTFMETRADRHPTDMASLRGARFVAAIETEQGRRWAESKVKSLTGGDKISARFMRQDFFEFMPQFKLIVAGNHKPAIRNIDEAMKRRLHLIPFTITVPPERRDKHLQQKLLAERDGILAWAVQGCLEWQSLGRLDPPQQVLDATDEYFEEEDAIGEFLDEDCQQSAVAREAISAIYQRWRERAERRGEYVGTSRWLTQQLINRGFARTRLHGGAKALSGLSLKPRDPGGYMPYRDD